MANLGPGSTDHHKPFGSDVTQKARFGKKHSFKPNLVTPGPGAYDYTKADSLIKSTSRKTSIRPIHKSGNYNPQME